MKMSIFVIGLVFAVVGSVGAMEEPSDLTSSITSIGSNGATTTPKTPNEMGFFFGRPVLTETDDDRMSIVGSLGSTDNLVMQSVPQEREKKLTLRLLATGVLSLDERLKSVTDHVIAVENKQHDASVQIAFDRPDQLEKLAQDPHFVRALVGNSGFIAALFRNPVFMQGIKRIIEVESSLNGDLSA